MKRTDKVILKKVIKYCDDIASLMRQYNMDYKVYVSDISFQYSCNMCIIQIGELVSRLSDEIQNEYSNIPWRAIKSMRNIHAHDYENVDLAVTWETLTTEVPDLKAKIETILRKED